MRDQHLLPSDKLGLAVHSASKSFGNRTLWNSLSFAVPQGQILAVTGPSGCGKSTLLNCIGLLDGLTSGSVQFDGSAVSTTSHRRQRLFRRTTLGYLFQNYALIDNATISQNLDVAAGAIRGFGRRQPHAYEEALSRVGLGGRGREMVFRLSGGEQQRVALARLIVKRAQLVLADEPTGALDAVNAAEVLAALRGMAQRGAVVLVATHSEAVVQACDSRLDLTPPGQVSNDRHDPRR